MPYFWNHTIDYDPEGPNMPFLVERLAANDLDIDFSYARDVLECRLTASIAKGLPPRCTYAHLRNACAHVTFLLHKCFLHEFVYDV